MFLRNLALLPEQHYILEPAANDHRPFDLSLKRINNLNNNITFKEKDFL